MVSLACTTTREDGVTLVTARIENSDRPRRVRVENRLDGEVWPPQRQGVAAEGWTDGGFECVLAADETRALGYASPASPADPPLVVAETEPVDPDAIEDSGEQETVVPSVDATPDDVVRELGSPRPPRDAVPVPGEDTTGTPDGETESESPPADQEGKNTTVTDGDGDDSTAANEEGNDSTAADGNGEDSTAGDGGTETLTATDLTETPGPTRERRSADERREEEPRQEGSGSEAVDDWLDSVETRVDLAEELSGTTRLPTVADALERAGGIDGLREVATRLDEDATELRRVAERASTLADRAETATVPVEQIERLR